MLNPSPAIALLRLAAELIFGVTSQRSGLGWSIFRGRNEFLTEKVFAGLAIVIAIDLFVELTVLHSIEHAPIGKLGLYRYNNIRKIWYPFRRMVSKEVKFAATTSI